MVTLFIRDALGLEVPAQSVIPPSMDAELPGPSELLDPERRATVGAAWPGWWQELLEQGVVGHQGPGFHGSGR